MTRLTLKTLHDRIGIKPGTPGYGTNFGPLSRAALPSKLSNPSAPKLTDKHFADAAAYLDVPVAHMRAIRKVEAPRSAFDELGRPSILYERHKFHSNTDPVGKFSAKYPDLSWKTGYGAGGYGKYSAQYDKLMDACALDPHAAFAACSWGAFQVLGEHAEGLGYKDPLDMALCLVVSEAAHLECFVKFIEANGLADELRACKAGNAASCIPFVSRYNGPGHAEFGYAPKLAAAIKEFS